MGFLIDKFNWYAGACITAAGFLVMLFDPSGNIGCNAGIKRIVRTADNIEMPHIMVSHDSIVQLYFALAIFSFIISLRLEKKLKLHKDHIIVVLRITF